MRIFFKNHPLGDAEDTINNVMGVSFHKTLIAYKTDSGGEKQVIIHEDGTYQAFENSERYKLMYVVE